jgi:hypothetical protein
MINKMINKTEVKKKGIFGFFARKTSKKRRERIKKLKEKREHKIKEKRREELFDMFGLDEETELTYVDLLRKVTKVHELKDRRRIREEDIFRKVEKFVKELKEKEEKIGKVSEEEAKDIFERLKKVIGERK